MQQPNYYFILGIPATATLEEIKKAHRSLSKKYHPDLNPGSRRSEEKFKEIQHAYEVLSNTERRQFYDSYQASNNQETAFNQNIRETYAEKPAEPNPTSTQEQSTSILNYIFFALTCVLFFANKCNRTPTPQYSELREQTSAEIAINEAKRQHIYDSVKTAQGRIFLYTNNPEATAAWRNHGRRSIVDDDEKNDRELLVKYNGHYYSFDYVLSYDNSNTKKHLCFIGYDNMGNMPTRATDEDSGIKTDTKFSTAWEIGITDIDDITTTSLSVPHMTGCLLFAKKIEGFQLLMVGVEKDVERPGMNLEEFQKSVKVFNQILKKHRVDTSHFELKIF